MRRPFSLPSKSHVCGWHSADAPSLRLRIELRLANQHNLAYAATAFPVSLTFYRKKAMMRVLGRTYRFAVIALMSALMLTPAIGQKATISFDAPGAGTGAGSGTFPTCINRTGWIGGRFLDVSSFSQHSVFQAELFQRRSFPPFESHQLWAGIFFRRMTGRDPSRLRSLRIGCGIDSLTLIPIL